VFPWGRLWPLRRIVVAAAPRSCSLPLTRRWPLRAGINYVGDNSSLIDGFDIGFAKLVRHRDGSM
jgi:hypothetical protein